MEKISIIVPCYNEEKALPLFYEELEKNIKTFSDNLDFEILFVNDGSKDNTLNIIKELAEKDNRIKYVSFSRNFGKESAIFAGLENSSGDYVTLMDADLQDPPSLLLQMYKLVTEEDYDAVGTRRVTREGEPIIRSFFARIFYKLINHLTNFEMVDGARDYVFMKRIVADAIISLKEYNRYSKGLFSFVGFKVKWIEYKNIKRVAGETKWSFWKLTKYALEGITAFSTTPLLLSSIIGLIFCLVSFLLIIAIIIKTLIFGDPTSGWPSLVCIVFMVSGIQLFSLGIIGQYLSKTYLEVKNRPIYIVKDTNINKI
ncbi:MAG TPA: glycosyltransferase family 2 protein [Candidatus Scatovivens faecipullorum]|nr:glycosyltransferase family 2 protein [Candidatus Scatovivens faecipullorum]